MPDLRKRRWILSVTSHEWDVDPHDQRLAFTEKELEKARTYLRQRFGMEGSRIMGAAVYCDAYSSTPVPLVLRPPEFSGKLSIATGTAGYGLKIAPALAGLIMEAENAGTS